MRNRRIVFVVSVGAVLSCSVAVAQQQFEPWGPRRLEAIGLLPAACVGGYAIGDVDASGSLDLVGGTATGAHVVFRSPVSQVGAAITTAPGPRAPSVVDLDGDGDLEVVLGPAQPATPTPITIARNDGTAFVNLVLPPGIEGAICSSVTFGDLDGDGDNDVLVSSSMPDATPKLAILRNAGNATFVLDTASLPAGVPRVHGATLLDFDRDGALDIVYCHPAGLRLFRNVGASFVDATPQWMPPTRANLWQVLAGDLDADGFVDIVASYLDQAVDVLWGSATGFVYQQEVVLWPQVIGRLYLADAEGDGQLEIVARQLLGFDLLHNLGGRQFAYSRPLERQIAVGSVADADGDGASDLLFTLSNAPNDVIMFERCGLGRRDVAWDQGVPLPRIRNRTSAPIVGDVDGDGRADLVFLTDVGLVVDLGDGAGSYRMVVDPQLALSNPRGGRLADFDGDGDLDLAVWTATELRVCHNDGTGAFATVIVRPWANASFERIDFADVDGDGAAEIALAHTGSIELLTRAVGGGYQTTLVHPSGVDTLRFVDVDGDGDADLVTSLRLPGAATGSRSSIVFENAAGTLTSNPAMDGAAFSSSGIRGMDIDGDGDLDLVMIGGGRVVIATNDGSGRFTDETASRLVTAASIFYSFDVGDVDGDGDVDVVLQDFLARNASVLINDGTGHFVAGGGQWISLLSSPVAGDIAVIVLDLVDIDGDDDLDLVGAQTSSAPVMLANQQRHLRSRAAPHLGGQASFDVYNGPASGGTGVAWLAASFGQASQPIRLPFLDGDVQLDAASLQVVAVVPTSSIGVSGAFAPVPAAPGLAGLDVWFQAVVFAAQGRSGVTNCVRERLLP